MARFFDAHDHLHSYPGPAGIGEVLEQAFAAGVKAFLCNGVRPEDWKAVLDLAARHKGVVPSLGLHPWFADKARPDWLEVLETLLTRAPACVGEIGLDRAAAPDPARQEHVFRAQLRLAKKLGRPVSVHCVKDWGRLEAVLKMERPPAFLLHAYGGPPEMVDGLARLGAYFSFSGEIMDPRREKMRRSLRAAPPERLLFETDFPGDSSGPPAPAPRFFRKGRLEDLAEVVLAASQALGQSQESLGALSWRNAKIFLGKFFPVK
ncbi:MAG: TatD family hydrolase [Elusimicrobiales bacterium]|jgi:TatD DNase family protein